MINSFLSTIGSIQRLLTSSEVTEFLDSIEHESTGTIEELIVDKTYHMLVSDVKDSLSLAFNDAEEFMAEYMHFRDMIGQNSVMSSEKMEVQYKEGARTLVTFEEDIEKYKQQLTSIEGIAEINDLGIIRINCAKLKEDLLPSPTGCLTEINTLLPQLSSQGYHDFISEVHQAISKLSSNPGTVEDFREFLEFLAGTQENKESFDQRYMDVVAHYELMDKFGIQVPDIEYAAYQTLPSDFSTFKSAVEVAEASRDDNVQKFSGHLEEELQQTPARSVRRDTELSVDVPVLETLPLGQGKSNMKVIVQNIITSS